MAQWEVCSDCKIKTIAEAIENASPADTIFVLKGIYREHELTLLKSLHLIGVGNPVIDGMEMGEILGIQADSVTVTGFTFRNVKLSHTKDNAAIHVFRSNHFTIENNILEDVFFGILLEKSKYGKIRNNKVSGNSLKEFQSGNGIHVWDCSFMEITNNTLHALRDGIYFEFVDESVVSGNLSYDNIRYGLHFMFSNHDQYFGNTFRNNGAGVAVMFSKFIDMRDNIFEKNWGASSFGLLLKEIYDAEIVNNTFRENTIAINVDGSSRINYTQNDLISNGWAIKITGGCYENIFSTNNFIGNSFDVSYNSKMNDNRFEDNYWSNYAGYDLDRDGIGDVPYRPIKLFSYIVNRTPETIVLLRSLFIDLLNFSEKVSPIFTPDDLVDLSPRTQIIP